MFRSGSWQANIEDRMNAAESTIPSNLESRLSAAEAGLSGQCLQFLEIIAQRPVGAL